MMEAVKEDAPAVGFHFEGSVVGFIDGKTPNSIVNCAQLDAICLVLRPGRP